MNRPWASPRGLLYQLEPTAGRRTRPILDGRRFLGEVGHATSGPVSIPYASPFAVGLTIVIAGGVAADWTIEFD